LQEALHEMYTNYNIVGVLEIFGVQKQEHEISDNIKIREEIYVKESDDNLVQYEDQSTSEFIKIKKEKEETEETENIFVDNINIRNITGESLTSRWNTKIRNIVKIVDF
jgi:hypothetical protein